MSPPRAQGWQCIIILLSWSLGANAFINSPLLAKKRPMQSIFSAKAPSTDDISFERLTGLSERIRLLLDKEVDYQMGFWDRDLNCFRLAPSVVDRVSVTSTCFSLFTILGNFEAWQGIVGASDADPHIRVPLSRMREALLAGRWTFDAFQTPIVISAMLRLAALLGGGGMGPDGTEQFNKGIRVLLDNRLRLGMHGRRSKVSAYVAYWNTCAFLQLLAYGAGASAADAAAAAALDARGAATAAVGAATPEEMRMAAETGAAVVAPQELVSGTIYGEVTTAVEQALVVSADEICRQMAYHAAGDYTNFDVVKLAYSLLTHHRVATSEGCFNRGPSMLNSKVVQKALDIVFMQQQPDGLWAQGQAIYNPGDPAQGAEGSAARVAADVGNSYAFTFDLLGSLLEVFSDVPSLVGKYHVQLERALMWAEDNVILQVYDEMCDVHRRTVEGTVVRGWRSNHLQTDQSSGPLGWSTAQVLFTLNRMRAAFRACLIKDVLSEFKGTVSTGANPQSWNRLMDSSLYLEGESASFKDTVAARLLSPLVDPQGGLPWAVSNRTPRRGLPPAYSAILFGPPGTAKTTTAQAIARYLGYNFLVVDTADFLADGMQNVASRMTYVFDKLKVRFPDRVEA
ncbi:unnamed protein product [Phaeothamnion confervicola]